MATVAERWADDPLVLALQVSRRLPSSVVQPAARLVRAVVPKNSFGVPVLLACHASGDTAGLQRRFAAALDAGIDGDRARAAADVALAANDPERAATFLELASNTARPPRKLPATQARNQRYGGHMAKAVAGLETAAGAGMARQRNRLAGELRIFQGWAPQLQHGGMAGRPSSAAVPEVPRDSKRVLHLLTNSLPHTASGYAQRTHSILAAQQQAGWDTLAVTRLGYPVQVGKLLARPQDEVDGVTYRRLLPGRLSATADGRLQQQAEELLAIAREFRPDVLHTTTHFVNGLVAREVAAALDIPWVYEVRGQLADTWAAKRGPDARSSEYYRLFQAREAELMRGADLVVTLGQAMKDNIVAAGVPEANILISPNAVGGDFLVEPGTTTQAREALGLPADGQYIGTVSSLVGYEGLDDLVAAFALLAPNHPGLRLLIVGDGTERAALQEQVRVLGLADRAIFTGRVPKQLTPLYHQALDVFVVPRKDLDVTRSVTPLKPVEAAASGRPVVASDLPALRELVNDGGTGRLVPAEDPDALARVLGELLDDPAQRIDLGSRGRASVLRTRTWAANAAVLDNAYQRLRRAG
ncbi:glycosyltransferase family 4 protein [Pseudarthrobacter sp. P1]|uniref:glycosyltransferase family 4 protein n=1 Tax=Pseudarthrobacter sp. P1 TaxID=3418418 RepID=UPI003CF44C94